MFLLDAAEVMPSAKEWPQVWEQQEGWKQSKKDHSAALQAQVLITLRVGAGLVLLLGHRGHMRLRCRAVVFRNHDPHFCKEPQSCKFGCGPKQAG